MLNWQPGLSTLLTLLIYPIAERVLSIPELFLLVLERVPPRTWPTLCLLSKSCAGIVQPHIWKTIAFNTPTAFKKIRPLIRKHGHHIETLDLDSLSQPCISSLLQELSSFRALPNITSLSLCHSQITPDQLSALLAKLPCLKDVDIRGCILHKHALEVLGQCKSVESIVFCQENVLLSPGYKLDTAFSPSTPLKRLGVTIRPNIKLLLAFQQFQETASKSQLNLESLELSASFWGLDALSRPCSWGSLKSITIQMNTLKKPMELNLENPWTQHMDVAGSQITSYEFKPLAHATKALTSLTLDRCESSSNRLRGILDQCLALERLHVHVLEGSQAVWTLFKNGPWACNKLQELVLDRIVWSSGDMRPGDTLQDTLRAMWNALHQLGRLRVLTLKHVHKVDGHGVGMHLLGAIDWFGVSRRIERLCMTGHGPWTNRNLIWITEHLPLLQEMEYNEEAMDKIQLAWLQERHPDIRLTVAANAKKRY